MKSNFQATVTPKVLSTLQVLFLEKNISSLDSVEKTSDACNVQSDLDLQCAQKVMMLSLKVKG